MVRESMTKRIVVLCHCSKNIVFFVIQLSVGTNQPNINRRTWSPPVVSDV